MTIVDELKYLISKRGGSTNGVRTISQAIKILKSLDEKQDESNPEPQSEDKASNEEESESESNVS